MCYGMNCRHEKPDGTCHNRGWEQPGAACNQDECPQCHREKEPDEDECSECRGEE